MKDPEQIKELEEQARQVRRDIIRMCLAGKSSHIGTALSAVDMLVVMYFNTLNVNPGEPQWPGRDRFILSKGHGGAALYAVLARRGFFPVADLDGYCSDGSFMIGHCDRKVPGVEVSTGSLGHGLSIGVGMALAARYDKASSRVFVLLGDGECDEGAVWEAAMSAGHFGLDGLTALVDHNKQQALGHVVDVMTLEPLAEKFKAFGWSVREIDGHDMREIVEVLDRTPFEKGRPSMIIANTVKGKGVSFMEDELLWHYKSLTEEEAGKALAELERR